MGKKIGISYWGFCEQLEDCNVANTPDGLRYGRPQLVDELLSRKHEVIALQQRRESTPYPGIIYDEEGYPDLDILFVEWRWPTWKNSGTQAFESDLDRQTRLVDHYHGEIPIIAFDTDLQITAEDEMRWPEMIIADPCFDPITLTKKRHRLPWWSDFKEFFEPSEGSVVYGYIGNNYNREQQFLKYYASVSQSFRHVGIQTMVYGNWMQHSPERPHPRAIIQNYPNVAFVDRVGFFESMKVLNSFICTTHISKDNYSQRGNVTMRYFETLACNVPALVPTNFYAPEILGKEWSVSSTADIFDKAFYLMKLNKEERRNVVEEQRYSFTQYYNFHVENTVDFIESFI